MRLSTTTVLFGWYGEDYYPSFEESMNNCLNVGFKTQDINLCAAIRNKSDLAADNWKNKIYNLGEAAAKVGVVFGQSHPVFITGAQHEEKKELWSIFVKMMERSIIASSMLGVEWAVIHPVGVYQNNEVDIEKSIKLNIENFSFAMELAAKYNVKLAYENMPNRMHSMKRFASRTEELIALVDEYSDSSVGVCWDFGHGNIIYRDQVPELKAIGNRLRMTHVADNYSTGDDHMLPFHGTTDWHSIMPVLTEIGYEGDFAFETHMETVRMPLQFRNDIARTTYKVGKYLLSLT